MATHSDTERPTMYKIQSVHDLKKSPSPHHRSKSPKIEIQLPKRNQRVGSPNNKNNTTNTSTKHVTSDDVIITSGLDLRTWFDPNSIPAGDHVTSAPRGFPVSDITSTTGFTPDHAATVNFGDYVTTSLTSSPSSHTSYVIEGGGEFSPLEVEVMTSHSPPGTATYRIIGEETNSAQLLQRKRKSTITSGGSADDDKTGNRDSNRKSSVTIRNTKPTRFSTTQQIESRKSLNRIASGNRRRPEAVQRRRYSARKRQESNRRKTRKASQKLKKENRPPPNDVTIPAGEEIRSEKRSPEKWKNNFQKPEKSVKLPPVASSNANSYAAIGEKRKKLVLQEKLRSRNLGQRSRGKNVQIGLLSRKSGRKSPRKSPSPKPHHHHHHHSRSPSPGRKSADLRAMEEQRLELLRRLERIRLERRQKEKVREEIVKLAKSNSMKINQRRNTLRDMWKKRFFEEKKKTSPLEDVCQRLRNQIDSKQQKLMADLGKLNGKPSATRNHQLPSVKNNGKMQASKLQHEVEVTKRQVETAKIKLTGEMKLRHQAEEDVKILRQELLTKKIRAHIAYRDLERTRAFVAHSNVRSHDSELAPIDSNPTRAIS